MKFVFLLCVLLGLNACGALINLKKYSNPKPRTLVKDTVFIEPHNASGKKFYLKTHNFPENSLAEKVKTKGYRLVQTPQNAEYGMEVFVKYFSTVNEKEWVSIASLYEEGNYELINIDKNGALNVKNENKEMRKLQGISAIMDMENLYRQVDFTGIISGSLTGFLIKSTLSSTLLGGMVGGAIFTVAAQITEPVNWLIIADVKIFEHAGKTVSEYNFFEYPKGKYGHGKVEYNRTIDRYEQNTRIISTVRTVFISGDKSKKILQNELELTLSELF
jgi:hypothetical protein